MRYSKNLGWEILCDATATTPYSVKNMHDLVTRRRSLGDVHGYATILTEGLGEFPTTVEF